MLIKLPYRLPRKIFRSQMPFSRFDKQDAWPLIKKQDIGVVVVLTEEHEYQKTWKVGRMVWKELLQQPEAGRMLLFTAWRVLDEQVFFWFALPRKILVWMVGMPSIG